MNEISLENKSFEELLQLLNESAQALEGDDLTLEEMLETYERSVRIVAECNRLLDEAELRVKRIDELLSENAGLDDIE